jgi:lipid-binding SYLF domain-containing protein
MKIMPLFLISAFALTSGNLWAASGRQDSIDRLQMSSEVLHSIMDAPDKGIPDEVVKNAKCIVVVPHLVKGGFVVGGEHGRGIASCRTADGGALLHSSPWAAEVGACRLASKALTSSWSS